MDWDYVGAPWLQCADSPWVGASRVGNGGFSLRKVSSFFARPIVERVLGRSRSVVATNNFRPFMVCAIFQCARKWFKQIKRFNNVKGEVERWHLRPDGTKNEDHFWADEAVRHDSQFKVALFQVGLDFAFEVVPRKWFELNQHRLPFGCHTWPRYDRSFWEPYLLKP